MSDLAEILIIMILLLFVVLFLLHEGGRASECEDICLSFNYPESQSTIDECKCLILTENKTKYYKSIDEILIRK
jgi:hypothetical protein